MKNAVERTKGETAAQVARTAALHSHFNFLVDKLVTVFGSVALPGYFISFNFMLFLYIFFVL